MEYCGWDMLCVEFFLMVYRFLCILHNIIISFSETVSFWISLTFLLKCSLVLCKMWITRNFCLWILDLVPGRVASKCTETYFFEIIKENVAPLRTERAPSITSFAYVLWFILEGLINSDGLAVYIERTQQEEDEMT